ncbi:hypothetical protein FHW88_005183 [Mucilaginibacter sp. SG538B]|uniref:hypothetical protein n=1 Tax=Mucilaginibacter sp. SG538B TaxID=2587021 RepID=UPI00159DAA62|nr:hypothetical protein [Mucilaginibacter sp. SG538B]NVM66865.1 hypothetical protein [Mucilaginibacter sp. SG538B]
MSERLAAHHENRTYYFTIESRKPGELKIMMYGTPYTFLHSGERWINYAGNLMEMKSGVIAAVMLAAGEL